ncbi:Hypothetical predicted protein [Prunus dulcis]|uniref:Uncharacterized protein n=1 Tax=Prunus dulcis TaxID=3755 RepID=A0A5E4F2H1_PRUDU|nr:Hypothetical predicted protein [Prunus dulcis]
MEGFKVLGGIGCLKKREIGGGDGRTERIAGVWMLRFRTKLSEPFGCGQPYDNTWIQHRMSGTFNIIWTPNALRANRWWISSDHGQLEGLITLFGKNLSRASSQLLL